MALRRPAGASGSIGLLAFLALLAIVCMVVPFSLGTSSLGSAMDDRMSESSRVTAQAVSAEISRLSSLLDTTARDKRLLAPVGNLGDVDNPHRELLRSLRNSNHSIKVTSYYDITGNLRVNSPLDASVGRNFADQAYFANSVASPGRPYISDPFKSELTGRPTLVTISIAVLAPELTDSQAVPVGVLLIGIDMTSVAKPFVDTFNSSTGVDVAVYDRNGKRVVGEMDIDDSQSSFQDNLRSVHNGVGFDGQLSEREASYLLSMTPVGATGFSVVSAAKSSSALVPLLQFQHRMVVLASIAGTAMLCSVLLLARSFRSRDKAIREMRTNGMRTELILETAAKAFVEIDDEGRITVWNGAAVDLFGWSREEALGKAFEILIVPEPIRDASRTEVMDAFATFSGSSVASKSERLVVRRNSTDPFPVVLTTWVTDIDGERRMGVFLEDVTERRQLDAARELVFRRQRELVEELRAADQTKTDFMSTVSHELRTPLTSILGYLEMLKDGYGGEFSKQASAMIDVIDRNSSRLLGLIEDLLTLSRIESGAEKTFTSLVDVQALADQAAQALLPSIQDRNLTLTLDIAANVPGVQGDPNQLERVLLNVLSNAVKFTPEGGRITMNGSVKDQLVVLEISDTGIGIPAEEQNRLFSRFFRSSTARDQAIQGTGLGLTIVKSIVERHGGVVKLSSIPNMGTTVTISLPAASQPVASLANLGAVSRSGRVGSGYAAYSSTRSRPLG